MDKEKLQLLFNNISPLGVLNDLSFEDFCSKFNSFLDREYPDDKSVRSGDPQLYWWQYIHECFEDQNSSFFLDHKWEVGDFFWNVNKVLGGSHEFTASEEILSIGDFNNRESFKITYSWDGIENNVTLDHPYDEKIAESINTILEKQNSPYLIKQYRWFNSDEIYFFRIKTDIVERFDQLQENPFRDIDVEDYLVGLDVPAREKCFINLVITSRDENSKKRYLNFQWSGKQPSVYAFNDKVEKGETLALAVKWCLKRDLGIEKIIEILPGERQVVSVEDSLGKLTQRYRVIVQVEFEPVKALQEGLTISWMQPVD